VPIETDSYIYELGQDEIDSADEVTLGQFLALAKRRGWSEDWLVEQCKAQMDNPRAIIREILDGYGLTKPEFMGSNVKTPPRQPERHGAGVVAPAEPLPCSYCRLCLWL
jgi:hypothetical protein